MTLKPPSEGWTTKARVTKIVDGDTVEIVVERTFRIRLEDCWAPEIHTTDPTEKAKGNESRNNLLALIPPGSAVLAFLDAGPTEAFGDSLTLSRVLGRIWRLESDGKPASLDVSSIQVARGFATPKKQ